MDHVLDFIFMWAVPVGYVFIVEGMTVHLVYVFAFVYSALMANSFLSFSATDSFKITYLGLGPTEVRLLFVILNTVIIIKGVVVLETIFPYVTGALALGLAVVVFSTQRQVWAIDMEKKWETQAQE